MINEILASVEDFEECIQDETLKVCFLHPNSKISKKGWSGFANIEEIQDTFNNNYNLGISLIGQEYPGKPVLTCIDIDGDKDHGEEFELISKKWAYIIITQKLDSLGAKYMSVRSSSGGYHIYIYCRSESLRYSSTKGINYPKNREKGSTNEELTYFLSGNDKLCQDIYGEPLPHSIVEIWCKKRYMVAPGSEIYDDEGNYVGTTTLLEDGVQNFKEIGIIDEPLNDVVREAFLENGFERDTRVQYSQKTYSTDIGTSQYLNDSDIEGIGEFLLEYLPKIHGQKHTFCLAFGGFLYKKGINLESVQKIGDYVVKRVPEGFFKNNEAFIQTLTHDITFNDSARLVTGLPTVEEILEPFCNKEIIGKQLHLLTNPLYHKFWPHGRYAKTYTEIVINYVQNYMIQNTIQPTITKDGELQENVVKNTKVLHNIEKIHYVDDISEKVKMNRWEKPVQIVFSTKFFTEESPVYHNTEALFSGYRQMVGAHGDYAKGILEAVYNEFESLNLIDTVESATRPGIWMSRKTNKLVKYINIDGVVQYVEPKKPSRVQLVEALRLLKKTQETYPWKGEKFGLVCKMALTMPYSYILKSMGTIHPSMILYGEAGTLKTTAGQLITYMNGDFSDTLDGYIISGGELNSEYRFGKKMDESSFPLIVNEPEQLFQNLKIRELIKDAVTGDLIRKPGGNDSRPYYSHRSSVYTMNALPATIEDPAYLRRFITIFFDRDERGDIIEVIKNLDFLNINGVKNARFKEFSVIGDFVYYYLHNNMNLLSLPLDALQLAIIEGIEDFTKENLDFMKVSIADFSYSDRTDQDNYTLSLILKLMREPYLRNKGKYFANADPISVIDSMIDSLSDYSYVHKVKSTDEEQFILLDIELKNRFNTFYGMQHKNITLKGIMNYLEDYDIEFDSLSMTPAYVYGTKKQVRGIKMSLNDFVKLLTGKKEI